MGPELIDQAVEYHPKPERKLAGNGLFKSAVT